MIDYPKREERTRIGGCVREEEPSLSTRSKTRKIEESAERGRDEEAEKTRVLDEESGGRNEKRRKKT